MQTQIDQIKVQAEEFRAAGNELQIAMQAQLNEMNLQLLKVNGSIDLLKDNMAHVHGKIDMGLIASHNNMNRVLMDSKSIRSLPVWGGTEKESFREWSFKLACVMERLKPGTRHFAED